VRGNALLGHLVHVLGADLHFEGVAFSEMTVVCSDL